MNTNDAIATSKIAATPPTIAAAAGRLQLTLDAISRRATGDAPDTSSPTSEQQGEALTDIYSLAIDGWFEFDAPGSTMTDEWLRQLVDDEQLPIETARAAAVVIAARDVYDSAVATVGDDSERAADDAMRCMARGAMRVLGADILRNVLAAVPAGLHARYLHEIGNDALRAGNMERVVAAFVIPMAGAILSSAETGLIGE